MLILKRINSIYILLASVMVVGIQSFSADAQVSMYDEGNRGSVYFSIGTNSASFKPTSIDMTQNNGGSFTLNNVEADNKTTSKSAGLQYNVRVGYFFDYNQTFAVELSYDPVKYHLTDGQLVTQTSTVDNTQVDSTYAFSTTNGYFYNIDGANLMSVNIVKRFQLFRNLKHSFRVDALAKAGIGPSMPHVYNSIAGKASEYPSFQFAGWNMGAAGAIRLTAMRHVYLEGAFKYSRATYSDIGIYNGTASQKLSISQVIFSIGYTFSTTRHNPLFEKGRIEYMPLTIKPIHQGQGSEGGSGWDAEPEPEPEP